MNKLHVFLFLGLILFFSGCITYEESNKTITPDNNINTKINEYENKLASCNDNDTCTVDYLDKAMNCQYKIDQKCLDERDNNNLKNDFIKDIQLCNQSLIKINLDNNCKSLGFNKKVNCIYELAKKTDNISCCNLILNNYEDIKNNDYKIALNKCEIDYVISENAPNICLNTNNKKECFFCYARNNHINPFTTNICTTLNNNDKLFCESSIFLNYNHCNNITNEKLKKECFITEINQNNCTQYKFDNLPINSNAKSNSNIQELINKTNTKLEIIKRKEFDVNEIISNFKTSIAYNFTFNNTNNDLIKLNKCNLDLTKIKLDYNKNRYSTFYFNYKEYQFVYTIQLYDDAYVYSKELKYQNCYDFKDSESHTRYFKDELNNQIINKVANDFKSLKNKGFSNSEIFEIVVRFVQEIPYNYLWENRNVYPYETLFLMKGVCLDKTIILAQLLKELGYETYIASGQVDYTNSTLNHALLAVSCKESIYKYNDKNVCFIESTYPYLINELPINNQLKFTKISDGKEYIEDSYGPNTAQVLISNEAKLESIKKELELINQKDWQNYNNKVNEYNKVLYGILKIRFKSYQ